MRSQNISIPISIKNTFVPFVIKIKNILIQLAAGAINDLFVHHFQTDQLLVMRGSFVLVVLSDRQYQYIPLSEYRPAVVTIPPNVPHAAIDFSAQPCVMVNAVLRHGAPYPKDYQPRRHPFPYDLDAARKAIANLELPLIAVVIFVRT